MSATSTWANLRKFTEYSVFSPSKGGLRTFSRAFYPCSLLRPLPIAFPHVFLIPVDWKVTGKEPFCRHLLDFVISRHASEASLAGLASIPQQEGADKSHVSPAPSSTDFCLFAWHWYKSPSFHTQSCRTDALSPVYNTNNKRNTLSYNNLTRTNKKHTQECYEADTSQHLLTPAYEGAVSLGRLQHDFVSPSSLLNNYSDKLLHNNYLSNLTEKQTEDAHTLSVIPATCIIC